MLRRGGLSTRVVEVVSPKGRAERVSNHMVVYVRRDFADHLRAGASPFLGWQVAQRFLNDESVILTPEEASRSHSERGLDLISLHSMYLQARPGEMGPLEHREAASRAFFSIHQGVRIWQFLRDSYSPMAAEHDRNAGMRVRSGYEGIWGERGEPSLTRPLLHGIDRHEALNSPGMAVERMFPHYELVLELRPIHRELLSRALVGETDEDLADSLGLSLAAVKSRWKAVYAHVEKRAPTILGDLGRDTFAVATRARERRRHLLNYLRDHLEELRPV